MSSPASVLQVGRLGKCTRASVIGRATARGQRKKAPRGAASRKRRVLCACALRASHSLLHNSTTTHLKKKHNCFFIYRTVLPCLVSFRSAHLPRNPPLASLLPSSPPPMAARHGKAEEPWSCCHVTSPSTPVAPLPALPQNFTDFHASLRSDASVLRIPHERVSAPLRAWGPGGWLPAGGCGWGHAAARARQARAPQPAAARPSPAPDRGCLGARCAGARR